MQRPSRAMLLADATASDRPMADWDRAAAVRTTIQDCEAGGDLFFAHRLIKVLGHPDLQGLDRPAVRCLEILALDRYMAGTEHIETQLVNPALVEILRLDLPSALHLDAYRIYTDEGYHALMSARLRHEILERHGLERTGWKTPAPLRRVLNWIGGLEPEAARLALITAASINETLITANLKQANDPELRPEVRAIIGTHAVDEARHHAYFRTTFPMVWMAARPAARDVVTGRLRWLLEMLLAPDAEAAAADLVRIGLPAATARAVAAATVSGPVARSDILAAARGSLAMLDRAGIAEAAFGGMET